MDKKADTQHSAAEQNQAQHLLLAEIPTRWQDAATALAAQDLITLSMPVVSYLEEADGVAFFLERHWEPDGRGHAGLSDLSHFLSHETATEIRELVQACRQVQTQILYPELDDRSWLEAVETGRRLVAELRAALEFVLDDGQEEPSDQAFFTANRRAAEDSTAAALAQALADYAGIGERNRERLEKIGGFRLALLDEARALATEITSRGMRQSGRPAQRQIELRNRLLTLLDERVSTVRRAARYLYRDSPELVRLVTSAYLRRRRAENRTKRQTTEEPVVVPGAMEGEVVEPLVG